MTEITCLNLESRLRWASDGEEADDVGTLPLFDEMAARRLDLRFDWRCFDRCKQYNYRTISSLTSVKLHYLVKCDRNWGIIFFSYLQKLAREQIVC